MHHHHHHDRYADCFMLDFLLWRRLPRVLALARHDQRILWLCPRPSECGMIYRGKMALPTPHLANAFASISSSGLLTIPSRT
jgi:hypothetical protein